MTIELLIAKIWPPGDLPGAAVEEKPWLSSAV